MGKRLSAVVRKWVRELERETQATRSAVVVMDALAARVKAEGSIRGRSHLDRVVRDLRRSSAKLARSIVENTPAPKKARRKRA